MRYRIRQQWTVIRLAKKRGKSKVLNRNGEDITREFIMGAEETLNIASQLIVKEFVARQRSPSCGCGQIYDGTFSGRVVDGDGVTTALLRRSGIKIIPEDDLQVILALIMRRAFSRNCSSESQYEWYSHRIADYFINPISILF